LCCAPFAALGQQQLPQPGGDPADRLFREQTERERARALERSQSTLGVTHAVPATDDENRFPSELPVTGPSFAIRHIRAEGDVLLPPGAFEHIVAPFTGQQLAAPHIQVLLDRLNKALVAGGYITSRAFVGQQNLGRGELVISFMAGRIERVVFDGQDVFQDGTHSWGIRLTLPFAIGEVLRLPDVEQAVDQLNRVRGNQIQVQIQPGQQVGGSIIELRNQATTARQAMVSVDNQGSASSGRWRTQVSLEQGNALGLQDTLSLGLTTSRDTNALYGTVSIPWGYNTLSLMGSWSEYQSLIADTALVYGTSNNLSLSFNRIIGRDQFSKTAVDLSMARRGSNRFINNAELTPQVLTIARAGVNRLTRTAAGDQWTVDAGWVQGLPALDALRDGSDLPFGAARAQFSKLEFSGSLQKAISVPWLGGLVWRSRVNGQWSDDALYSSEQISAGGVSSVRGFAESAAAGDRGMVWRNELVREGTAVLWDGKARADAYVYCDAAHVTTVTDPGGTDLMSVGAGLRMNFLWRNTQGALDLILGIPVRYPETVPDTGTRLNLSLNLFF